MAPSSVLAKPMIHDQELPMFLWAKVCNTTIYVQSRSPYRIMGDKTLEEAFIEVKPEMGHLRIFSCSIYIHVPMKNKTVNVSRFDNGGTS